MAKYLENSLEKVARILARQYNVTVSFEGEKAYTDGRKIVLPFFQNLSPELEKDLHGYLDHEVAHVRYTDFKELRFIELPYHHQLLNVTEDIRIERLMQKDYPGTVYHIEPLRCKVETEGLKFYDKSPWSIKFLFKIQEIMRNKPTPEAPEIEPYLTLCDPEIKALNQAKNTKEIRVLTAKIMDKLKQVREKEKAEAKKASADHKKLEEQEKKKDAQEKNKSENSKKANTANNGEAEKSSRPPGLSEFDEEIKPSMTKKEIQECQNKENGDRLLDDPSLNEKDFAQVVDIHKLINQALKSVLDQEKKQTIVEDKETAKGIKNYRLSIPTTTRFDKVTDFSGKDLDDKTPLYPKLKRSVSRYVNPLKQNLERIFKVLENKHWKNEREEGTLNARSLHKLVSSPNYRTVFKQQVKTLTDNTAVCILLDLSGSMSGQKLETAKLTATAMGEALKDLNIPFEILGFNTLESREMHDFSDKILGSHFNRRRVILNLQIFKSFESTTLAGLTQIRADGCNDDGECVFWAAKRLAQRSEKRKIFFVLSDGQPSSDGDTNILWSDLHSRLRQIKGSGIETVGLGILTDAVKYFYEDYLIVSDLKDLTSTAMKTLSKLLLRKVA